MSSANSLYRLFWRWHFFAALLVIPFVLWQGVTGSLYLWSGQWMDWRHPELRFVDPHPAALPISRQLRAVLDEHRGDAIAEIIVPEHPNRSTTVLLRGADGLVRPIFVDRSGHVVGGLDASAWLPGITRSLHGGWPLGTAGSWLLELGDCWAIVMIATGLYLWWPRNVSWLRALWPRLTGGRRIFWRDLHACVAVWFALLILGFLITALPWTAFWGGHVLGPVQQRLGQDNPAGFDPGGATGAAMASALPALDRIIAEVRQRDVVGALQVRLANAPNADWWIHNVDSPPGRDRYVLGDRTTGEIRTDVHGRDNPLIARLIDAGVHLHQADYGALNRWANTAVAAAVIWMSITGFVSWWLRRPRGALGAPPPVAVALPKPVAIGAVALCLLLPLLGLSVAALYLFDGATRWMLQRA